LIKSSILKYRFTHNTLRHYRTGLIIFKRIKYVLPTYYYYMVYKQYILLCNENILHWMKARIEQTVRILQYPKTAQETIFNNESLSFPRLDWLDGKMFQNIVYRRSDYPGRYYRVVYISVYSVNIRCIYLVVVITRRQILIYIIRFQKHKFVLQNFQLTRRGEFVTQRRQKPAFHRYLGIYLSAYKHNL